MVINGLLDGLNGWNTIFAPYECPGINSVRMGVWTITGCIPGHVGEISFKDCSGLALAGRFLPPVVIVGPPPTIAIPAICVTGKEILLGQVLLNPVFDFDVGL